MTDLERDDRALIEALKAELIGAQDKILKLERYLAEARAEVARLGKKFLESYAHRSGVTPEWLEEQGQIVMPCFCDDPKCPGWQMTNSAIVGDEVPE